MKAEQQIQGQFDRKANHPRERQALCPSSTSNCSTQRRVLSLSFVPRNAADLAQTSQDPPLLQDLPVTSRKRKRSEAVEHHQSQEQPLPKRSQGSRIGGIAEGEITQNAVGQLNNTSTDTVEYWVRTTRWHKRYFEQDNQVRKDFESGRNLEEYNMEDWVQEPVRQGNGVSYLLARKKSSSSLRRKNSESSITTPSDQKPREAKSYQYAHSNYETLIATKGSFMKKSSLGVIDASKVLCRTLLSTEQSVPQDTLFRDDLFDETCESVQARNEAMVVRDISPLICPSAQVLRIYGAKELKPLTESVNEGWNSAIPLYGSRPQPDYSVGFGRSAFTDEQLEKLRPFVGDIEDSYTSYLMATWRMYFPFLTCEVKCGAAALDIADRQNAHSMTLAVRRVVELFKLVKREKELDREILAFSISHDHCSVRIYGHYALVEDRKTTFYRHPIRRFDFTEQEGKDKWSSYKFTKSVYNTWMPTHLKRLCSAIDQIPADVNFEVSERASFSAMQDSQQSNADSLPFLGDDDSIVGSQDTTPRTSYTQGPERQFKKPKNTRAAGQH